MLYKIISTKFHRIIYFFEKESPLINLLKAKFTHNTTKLHACTQIFIYFNEYKVKIIHNRNQAEVLFLEHHQELEVI